MQLPLPSIGQLNYVHDESQHLQTTNVIFNINNVTVVNTNTNSGLQ